MKTYKEVLIEEKGKPVVIARDVRFELQNNGGLPNMGVNENPIENGNFSISGKVDLFLSNGQVMPTDMEQINIRLGEIEKQLEEMEEGEAKDYLQQKFDIWKTFQTEFKAALKKALAANYSLKSINTED